MHITGGFLKSRKIESPKGSNVRPTLSQVRESVFSTLFSITDFEDKSFLDAFAGSGIMGFEAISRGFKSCSFFEKDKKTFFLLKTNAQKLNVQAEFYLGDTAKLLKKAEQSFDIIYVDPPYQSGLYDEIVSIIKEKKLLNPNGILILEYPKDLNIQHQSFNIIKTKIYSDKAITFLSE